MDKVQNIVACTTDAALLRRLRVLLSRDDTVVESVATSNELETRLTAGDVALVILEADGADDVEALSLVARIGRTLFMPPTLVLGGDPTASPPNVRIVADPADMQATYRAASDLLGRRVDIARSSIPAASALANDVIQSGRMDAVRRTPDRREPTEISDEPLDIMETSPEPADAAQPMAPIAHDEDTVEPSSPRFVDESLRAPARASMSQSPTKPSGRSPAHSEAPMTRGSATPLEATRLARALIRAWKTQTHGSLILRLPGETLTFSLESGVPVALVTTAAGDRFGRNLVKKGKLTEAQYGDAAKIAVERGIGIAAALMELGTVARDQHAKELAEDAHDRLVQSFGAKAGTFELVTATRPAEERPLFRLSVGAVVLEGLKRHCDDQALEETCGSVDAKYFRLRTSVEDVVGRFPLTSEERSMLGCAGRAYNIADAAELSGLSTRDARLLIALLVVADEFVEFVPTAGDFEHRIKEERQRNPGSLRPSRADVPSTRPAEASRLPELANFGPKTSEPSEKPSVLGKMKLPNALAASAPLNIAQAATAPATSLASLQAPPMTGDVSSSGPAPMASSSTGVSQIPVMPVPPAGQVGKIPRPIAFAPPSTRSTNGQESTDRTRSRQHFQRGVGALGQGAFEDAEEAFREAIALVSEEHVYFIGLARSIYYNPVYSASGKVPLLRTIVDRAFQLAPEDPRVLTLMDWIKRAEETSGSG